MTVEYPCLGHTADTAQTHFEDCFPDEMLSSENTISSSSSLENVIPKLQNHTVSLFEHQGTQEKQRCYSSPPLYGESSHKLWFVTFHWKMHFRDSIDPIHKGDCSYFYRTQTWIKWMVCITWKNIPKLATSYNLRIIAVKVSKLELFEF